MATYVFEVTVEADLTGVPPDDEYGRDPATAEGEYAQTALYSASLRDADRLDGYADLEGSANITNVHRID